MTSPQNTPPENRSAAARSRGRHRSEPVAPPQYPAPPQFQGPPQSGPQAQAPQYPGQPPYQGQPGSPQYPGPAPQPGPPPRDADRFNGFVPTGSAPTPPPDSGYRSLADLSAERPTPAPATAPDPLRGLRHTAEPAPTSRWTRRRVTILGIVGAVVLAVLISGGYAGYRYLGPYYGLGYVAGRSTTIDGLTLTTDSVKCGLDTAPFGNSGTPRGLYCAIVVNARNHGDSTASIDLRTWTADLDVGLTGVAPVSDWLALRNEIVEPGSSATFRLAYDIPRGARLTKLHLAIDDKSGVIATT